MEKTGLTTYGTSSTASKTQNSSATITASEVELGRIEVVCEVDIDTESMPTDNHDGSMFFDDGHNESKDTLRLELRLERREVNHSSIPQLTSGEDRHGGIKIINTASRPYCSGLSDEMSKFIGIISWCSSTVHHQSVQNHISQLGSIALCRFRVDGYLNIFLASAGCPRR